MASAKRLQLFIGRKVSPNRNIVIQIKHESWWSRKVLAKGHVWLGMRVNQCRATLRWSEGLPQPSLNMRSCTSLESKRQRLGSWVR